MKGVTKRVFSSWKIFFLFVFILCFVFVFLQLFGSPGISLAESSSSSESCTRFNAENTSLSGFYDGFGVPWDVFSSSQPLLLRARCEDDVVDLTVGTGNTKQYIWDTAYVSKDGNWWRPVDLSGNNKVQNWFVGSASAELGGSQIDSNGKNYFLAYVCTADGGEWSCGCRGNNSCSVDGLWQLQEVDITGQSSESESESTPADTQMSSAFHAPTISFPSDYVVSPGENVTLSGGGFSGTYEVFINGYGAVLSDGNDSQVSFEVPKNIAYGVYDIYTLGTAGESNTKFIVVKDPNRAIPSISGLSDTSVQPGESVTLYGSGFNGTKNEIRTNMGIVSGVPSSNGQSLTFTFPEKGETPHLPASIKNLLQSNGLTASVRDEMQDSRSSHQSLKLSGTVVVVNSGGISNTEKFSIIQ